MDVAMCLDTSLFSGDIMIINSDANSKEKIIKELAKKLYEEKYVKESYMEAVLKREEAYPTGIPTKPIGVAIPHTDIEHIIKPGIAVATLINPVTFNEMGAPENVVDVRVVFMLAVAEPHMQIQLLQGLMSIIQNKDIVLNLLEQNNYISALDVLSR